MAYYLRKENKKKGIYLQMYESYWDKEKKQPRSKSVMAFGYVQDLISDEVPDPIAYYTELVARKNEERAASLAEKTRPRAFAAPVEYNLGHFLLHTLLEEMNVREVIDILAAQMRFQFSVFDMISQLIFSRVIYPCSKSKTVSAVFPHLYNSSPISEDQVYDGLSFIGGSYKKYIELFNHCYGQHYQRDFSNVFFDCTNYYFEIDLPCGDKQKGPSKENRHDPIIGQALLLDADLVPLAMQMYPGNESEKPYLRKIIEEMKARYKISGKTVQVADKGLNCARNIYAAVKEAGDGYIFSRSIHGRSLSEKEKKWVLLENDKNVWKDYRDKDGKLLYRLKSCVDTFSYQLRETDPESVPLLWDMQDERWDCLLTLLKQASERGMVHASVAQDFIDVARSHIRAGRLTPIPMPAAEPATGNPVVYFDKDFLCFSSAAFQCVCQALTQSRPDVLCALEKEGLLYESFANSETWTTRISVYNVYGVRKSVYVYKVKRSAFEEFGDPLFLEEEVSK